MAVVASPSVYKVNPVDVNENMSQQKTPEINPWGVLFYEESSIVLGCLWLWLLGQKLANLFIKVLLYRF